MTRFYFLILIFILPININASEQSLLLYSIDSNKVLYSKNEKKDFIPASTIKILTALISIEKLGLDYRFSTKAFLDKGNNLYIKGYGDPLFTTDQVKFFSFELYKKLYNKNIKNIYLVNSFYMGETIRFRGTHKNSNQPYDSPNNPLAINFNSICFKKINNNFISCESKTPLLKEMIPYIKSSSLRHGRIPISEKDDLNIYYPGFMIRYFLNKNGLQINGKILKKDKVKNGSNIILDYKSEFNLKDIIYKMNYYSNNFTANQLFLKCGVNDLVNKASKLNSLSYLNNYLKKNNLKADIYEGSGISRRNRISSKEMLKILIKFSKYYKLLKSKDNKDFYKTGTLHNVRNKVGYYINKSNKQFIYIIFSNRSNKPINNYLKKIKSIAEKS